MPSVPAEPDRRSFVRSSVRYLDLEVEATDDASMHSSSSQMPSAYGSAQSSLAALREVISEESPRFLPVDRDDTLALHGRVQKIPIERNGFVMVPVARLIFAISPNGRNRKSRRSAKRFFIVSPVGTGAI